VHHDFVTPESYGLSEVSEERSGSAVIRGIGKSFGYNKQEVPDDFLSVPELVRLLVDIVSKNGNLLLNVGPKPGGEIPEVSARQDQGGRRVALGQWWRYLWNPGREEGRRAHVRWDGSAFTSKPGFPVRRS